MNLVWNWFNFSRTNKIRQTNIRYDEFKRLRAAVDAALQEQENHRATLESLEASGSELPQLREEVGTVNKNISASYNALVIALDSLDQSEIADGNNWAESVSAPWDELSDALNGVWNPAYNIDEVKRYIKRAALKLESLNKLIRKRLDAEVNKYTNA